MLADCPLGLAEQLRELLLVQPKVLVFQHHRKLGMKLQGLMRIFSIRQRMIGAIVVVLSLLAVVSAAGGWGIYRQSQLANAFMTEALVGKAGLSELRLTLF